MGHQYHQEIPEKGGIADFCAQNPNTNGPLTFAGPFPCDLNACGDTIFSGRIAQTVVKAKEQGNHFFRTARVWPKMGKDVFRRN